MNDVPAESAGLVRVLRVLRERWLIVVIVALACLGGALARGLTTPDQYDATARLLFAEPNLPPDIASSAPTDLDPAGAEATRILLVTSREVSDAVRRRLELRTSTDTLLSSVTVTPDQNSDLASITVRDENPRLAADVANAFAEEYVAFRKRSQRAQIREAEGLVRQRLNSLAPDATDERRSLSDALASLVTLGAAQTGDAEVVDRAAAPTSPSAPRLRRDAAVALVLGLALGVALAFLLNALDRRVKTVEDFEGLYGVRALASIPQRSGSGRTRRDRAIALEPFRILRNALGFLAVGRPIRVVMVTSAMPGEGKTTVAAGLARAAAQSGQTVVLVECDLRRPTFQRQFDLGPDSRGLTTALVGGMPVSELVRQVLPGLPTLTVLPAGPLPPNAAELLRSPEMARLLGELAAEADLVLLDAPPLLPVADSHVLLDSPQLDACLVVARSYRTQRDEVRRARAILDRHRLANLGLVVNGVREHEGTYDYYMADEDQQPGGQTPSNGGGATSASARPTRRS